MKRKWHHPDEEQTGSTRQYWRGYDELEDTAEFRDWLEREFPRGAAELADREGDQASRRNFLKLMGASAGLAGLGLSSCRRPEAFIVPYNEHVEWIIPGKATLYASAMPTVDGCVPLVVTTYEGRPTKVDGNRLHPVNGKGCDSFTQASVLNLYDPDRSRAYRRWEGDSQVVSNAEEFEKGFLTAFRASGGAKTALLIGANTSPTRARLLQELKAKYPQIQVFQYEPLVSVAKQQAEAALYGEGVSAVPAFERATRILSLDCDFLCLDSQGENDSANWAKGRNPDLGENMGRLYAVEPAFTITGGAADHRLRVPASQVVKVAAVLAERVGELAGNAPLQAAAAKLVGKFKKEILNLAWIEGAAKDLVAAKGKALVVAGSRQPVATQILAGLINQALGSVGGGGTVQLVRHGRAALPGIGGLAAAIAAKQVETLISLTPCDPMYDAPADLKFPELCKTGLKMLIHCGERYNHTATMATWHVPGAHYLESWGDAYSRSGIYSVVQPMILPLFGGVSEIDFLLSLLNAPVVPAADAPPPLPGTPPPAAPSYEAVKSTFAGLAKGNLDQAWSLTLRDGFLNAPGFPAVNPTASAAAVAALDAAVVAEHPHKDAVEVVLTASSHVWDGRFINNSWMQEVPDPITKLTWDNAAVMSIKTAEQLGIERDGQMLSIKVGETEVQAPAFRIPGHADFTVTLELGWGQGSREEVVGRVGANTGFNAYPLFTAAQGYIVSGAKVALTGADYKLAATAIHWSMEGRALVREGTRALYEDPHYEFSKQGMDSHIPANIPLYKGPDYGVMEATGTTSAEAPLENVYREFHPDDLHQWAMTIDLNTCVGCNACAIACQAENNIPVVGKEQVIFGREMHWIRMDRYFSSPRENGNAKSHAKYVPDGRGRPVVDDDAVEMTTQPVACVQCEYAPCETVCPVNATVHTDDGLNAMTYNRCIGTRYCANNCPYKARRFNYFDYNKRWYDDFYLGPLADESGLATGSLQLQKNPNVTVRMRGVIEKCTYCVQRIQKAKIEAKVAASGKVIDPHDENHPLRVKTGVVTVACQDACGTGAISFGNLKDPNDPIVKLKGDPRNNIEGNKRNYDLLKYIGTRPRTSYLAKIRNPNMEMPGAEHIGRVTADMH